MSRERLEEHRRIWKRKPVLADVYAVWFDALLGVLPSRGRILEVGAGPGFLSAYARRRRPEVLWVATDLVEAPWNDLVADGLGLPVREGSVHAIAALDLVHHLARPERFFREARRVLVPGGVLAVIEPWLTPFSYPIYRWLHQEGCRPGIDPWNPFGAAGRKEPFEGDSGVFTRLLRQPPPVRWRDLGLGPPRLTLLNGFAYLLSLGFREASLLPRWLAAPLLRLDGRASSLARYVGLRALVVWERLPS
ncbi:MAG: class I SAM-dependent methyltransferase [Acidobacteria bacterium]|nr:class I SAM-dependent methyltransferase [Acidobacteriota bacterium]